MPWAAWGSWAGWAGSRLEQSTGREQEWGAHLQEGCQIDLEEDCLVLPEE